MHIKLRAALLFLLAAVFLFSGYQFFGDLNLYREGQNAYQQLEQYVSHAPPPTIAPTEAGTEPSDQDSETQPPDLSIYPQVDFEALAELNPDIVAWIHIEGTGISYPVVRGSDNDYYLNHLFDGSYNRSGSIFLDYRCHPGFTDSHSIIYGHHMQDQSMFSELMGYKDPQFHAAHPTVLLVTPTAYYQYDIFSGYVTDDLANAWDLKLQGEEFSQWLSSIQSKSYFPADAAPDSGSQILTLSTCSYEFEDAKFVLHCFLTEYIEK